MTIAHPPDRAGFGVVVRGSGPVSLAFALLLRRQGLPATAIELTRQDAPVPDWLGSRTLALGQGSWQLLDRICGLPPAAPISRVEVSLAGHAGRTHLDAAEQRAPALGWVTRHRDLHRTLQAAIAGQPFAAPDGPALDAAQAVIVNADGDTGDDARVREFDQTAVLVELQTGLPDQRTAFERFTPEGPLAMLPLPEPGRYSLVWCASNASSQRRMAQDDAHFCAELQQALGPRFGHLAMVGRRVAAPLVRRARNRLVQGHEVWIGNAAQALHPVAGQGLNLGLRDAFVLARCLGDAAAAARADASGLSAPSPLDRAITALDVYRHERRVDRQSLLGITDLLASVFTVSPLRPLQSVALAALDLAGPLRAGVARRLMFGFR